MSISSQIVAELMAAGLTGDALIAALRRIEEASPVTSQPSAGALRTRRWRERQEASQSVTETSRDVTVTNPPIPVEEGVTRETAIGIGQHTSQPSPRRTATRLPEDWQPKPLSPDFRAKITLSDERIAAELEQFRDHFIAKPGEKGRSMDWNRSWQAWLRNAVKWDAGPSRRPFNGKPAQNSIASGFAKINAALDERIRSEGGEQNRGEDSERLSGLRQGPGRLPSLGH